MRETRVEETGLRTGVGCLLIAAMSVGCLSSTAGGSAGSGGAGGDDGRTGPTTSTGGKADATGAGGFHEDFGSPGSCDGQSNPDFENNGSCSAMPSDPPPPCTRDCCVPCGIDASGTNRCVCDVQIGTYSSCTCTPPTGFPLGLSGGNCSPQ